MSTRMLSAFAAIFAGKIYRHRANNQGDLLATQLYEDLHAIKLSDKYVSRVDGNLRGISVKNVRVGIKARRGDGTFGEFIPGQPTVSIEGFSVHRGPVATLEIGIEVKILNKAMIKQINDRIAGLQKQADYFVTGHDGRERGKPISIAIIGVNYADYCVGYEGERKYKTDGHKDKHPAQEAQNVERRIEIEVKPRYDETIILRYKATNETPFPFSWVNEQRTILEYNASLVRLSSVYESRF